MANEIQVTQDSIFRISAEGAPSEVRLSSDAWRVLSQVNAVRSLAEIASNLNADIKAITHTAEELVRLGLLAVDTSADAPLNPTVNRTFFERIEKEFVSVMGPMGPLLIEEQVSSLGESRDQFPREKVAALVEQVGAQIGDEKKRLNFLRLMLTEMQRV